MPNTSAIRFAETGGPAVLQITEAELAEPGPGQALVGVHASGVNFIDTYHRSGLYPVDLPFIPGSEGAGIVEAVGADVTDVAVGDRVAWVGVPGSYAGRVLAPTEALMPIPDGVSLEIAAALPPRHDRALPGFGHQAAPTRRPVSDSRGGRRHGTATRPDGENPGAEVVATAGSPEKGELARSAGADHVVLYNEVDLVDGVEAAVGTNAIDVVFDGVGAATFDAGLHLLAPAARWRPSETHPEPYRRSRRWR